MYLAEDSDHEAIQKLKHGTIYSNDVTAPRNIKRHRRFWALLDITFDYWQPQTMVAEVERETVNRLQNYFIKHGISEDATIALCQGFLVDLEQHRAEYQTGKDRESFPRMGNCPGWFLSHSADTGRTEKSSQVDKLCKLRRRRI